MGGSQVKVKWLFFDVGSTLVDESNVYERRFKKIAEAASVSAEDVKAKALELYKQNKKGDLELTKQLRVSLPKWETEKEILYPDTVEVLKQLHEKYKIGVIANQVLGTADRLEAFGILKYIDLVIASAEEGVAKPDRKIFDIALERANVAPDEAFMIGDRIDNDIVPAKNIGMKTMWIRQGFGGLWKIQSDAELPNFIADNLPEVVSILDGYENSKSLLETTMNTRDLGGHLCNNGETTKYNRIIRSDKQNYPSARDIEFLTKNGITTIIDLREEKSVKSSPSAFINREGFTYFNFPIEEGSQVPESIEAVPESYMEIAASPMLKSVFTTMAEADTGVMFNCSAGKDRSGVVTAILLMLCDVQQEEIVADYMLTKEYNKERFKMAAIHHPDIDLSIIIPREKYIKDFMKMFYQEFGTVEEYFRTIGISDEIREKLRCKLMR
jgi:HAD superfamily hydrolase (TIGR01549 family)